MDEYEHIQGLRKTWSELIMDWLRIMIPVGAAFDGLFSYFGKTNNLHHSWVFPIVGWLLFVIPLITWRVVVHYIDRQIVDLYPRMLELEQQMPPQKELPMQPPWHTHATYYFNNLTQQARHFLLEHALGLPRDEALIINYQQYRDICNSRGRDPHGLLLNIWDNSLGRHSVISRGHKIQDVAVGIICIVTFSIACILASDINKQDCQFWVYLAIGLSAILTVIFALIAARCLIKR